MIESPIRIGLRTDSAWLRVLLIDNDKTVRDVAAKVLEVGGCQVTRATGGV